MGSLKRWLGLENDTLPPRELASAPVTAPPKATPPVTAAPPAPGLVVGAGLGVCGARDGDLVCILEPHDDDVDHQLVNINPPQHGTADTTDGGGLDEPRRAVGARFDFECGNCTRRAGRARRSDAIVYEDLPAQSERCPVCGHKRGFKKLFNAVNVSTRGHRAARFIDRQMRPAMDEHSAVKQSAKRFEHDAATAMDKAWHAATTEEREQLAPVRSAPPMHQVGAQRAMGMVDPAARADSRNYTMPMLQMKRVKPAWTSGRGLGRGDATQGQVRA